MTYISSYGYDAFTITVSLTVASSCISFSLESILSSLSMVTESVLHCCPFLSIAVAVDLSDLNLCVKLVGVNVFLFLSVLGVCSGLLSPVTTLSSRS